MNGKRHSMRHVVLGGVARTDVSRALSELARRNLELQTELGTVQQAERELFERVQAAEGTLETFHGLLHQTSHLLAMAEERACEVRVEAERDAARLRAEVDGLQRELEELSARKVQAMDDLLRLGSIEQRPAPEPAPLTPVTVLVPQARERSLEDLFLEHVEANTRS